MERLTYRTELGVSIDKQEDCPTCSICCDCDIPPRKCRYISDALEKLAKYEDLEEQGRLVKLPCKVGDTVYVISMGKIISLVVEEISTFYVKNEKIINVKCQNADIFRNYIEREFGRVAFFPKEDLSEIYAKCWSADGQIKTIAFKPSEIMDANNTTPNGEKSKIDALGDATEGIISKLDVMADKINAIEQKLAIKTTKSKASQE